MTEQHRRPVIEVPEHGGDVTGEVGERVSTDRQRRALTTARLDEHDAPSTAFGQHFGERGQVVDRSGSCRPAHDIGALAVPFTDQLEGDRPISNDVSPVRPPTGSVAPARHSLWTGEVTSKRVSPEGAEKRCSKNSLSRR